MDRKTIKKNAKEQIKGSVIMALLAVLICCAIESLSAIVPVLPILVVPILHQGMVLIYMDIRDKKGVNLGKIFEPFEDFGRVWCANFLTGLFTFLWSLLFVIPGIVKSLSYAMTPYIIAENPEIKPLDAIKESQRIMKGHKFDLFVLGLSFIGWIVLGCITFGLVFIYVNPYMEVSIVNFYDSIKTPKEEIL